MQYTVTYTTGMYSQLSKTSSPIKLLILDTCHADTLYLPEDQWLFFQAKRGPRAELFEKHRSILRNTAITNMCRLFMAHV